MPANRPRASFVRVLARWTVVVIAAVHGLIHLLGAAKGLGWAEVAQLRDPIGPAMGLTWLAAALVVVAAALLLAFRARWWWSAAASAAVVSQAVIVTSWSDAAVGSLANVVMLLAAGYGYLSHGPRSHEAMYRTHAATVFAEPPPAEVVTDADLTRLPEPVARYVRQSGAVGKPRIANFHARMHGRIRSGPTKPWMTFTAEQVNTYGADPGRLFLMDATMFELPVDVFHTFIGPDAEMRVKLCSLVPMVDAASPELAQAETVTLFNELCVLAPAALVDAPVTWEAVDDEHRARGTYRNGDHTVSAELLFNERDELIDFISDDRLATSPDGTALAPRRWSTPLSGYRQSGGRRVAADGEGRWHATPSEAAYPYVELHLDDIRYNATTRRSVGPLSRRELAPAGRSSQHGDTATPPAAT